MNREFEIGTNKTYATTANARRAIAKAGYEDLRHFITFTEDGRAMPVFVGQEAAMRGVHFTFNVVS